MSCNCPSRLLVNLVLLVDLPSESPGRCAAHPPLLATSGPSSCESVHTRSSISYIHEVNTRTHTQPEILGVHAV
jgi:hypothetical protein